MLARSSFALALVLITCGYNAPARAQRTPDGTLDRSVQVLSEITRNPKTGMPRTVMRNARAIVIIPEMLKAGFIIGARFGRGVLVVKQPDGSWSNPLFIHLMGGSFGFQAGAQSTDLILVFQSPGGLDRFLKGKGKLTLGVDASAAAGPAGKRFEASTDAGLKAEILSYSSSRGLFAGVSAEGGTLQIDWKSNAAYYNKMVSAGEVLAVNSPLDVSPTTMTLKQILAEKTALPAERVAKSRRGGSRTVIVEDDPIFDDRPLGSDVVSDRPISGDRRVSGSTVDSRSTSRGESRPQARPGTQPRISPDDDFDDLPEEALPPRNRSRSSSRTSNDEDLPSAVPGPSPDAYSGTQSQDKKRTGNKPALKPQPQPKPKPSELDDDVIDLNEPR